MRSSGTVVLDPSTGRIYVANQDVGVITVLDTNPLAVAAEWLVEGRVKQLALS